MAADETVTLDPADEEHGDDEEEGVEENFDECGHLLVNEFSWVDGGVIGYSTL